MGLDLREDFTRSPIFLAPLENRIAVLCSSTIAPQENQNQNYDNSTLKTINGPVAFATRFPSRPTHARLLCAFADSERGMPSQFQRNGRV